jgi:dUTP pyrophosphatase
MATYKLSIWLDPTIVDEETANLYIESIKKHNNKISEWKKNSNNICVDAGFDLFVPDTISVNRVTWARKINMGVKTSMTFKQRPSSYYLYSRSSTPIKTPLRLSNSVGIIDSGYRGHIIALFDNIEQREYTIQKNDRLVQICSPNITYPIEVSLVNSDSDFLSSTRDVGGFGSTD